METQNKGSLLSVVSPAPYVTQKIAAAITGYTVRAIETKRHRGEWREGEVWVRAPDGTPLISIQGYTKWAESGRGSR